MAISATGLGIVPAVYVLSGVPHFADYAFRPLQAWLGAAAFAASLWLFHRTHKDLGRNWSVTLEVRDRHALVTNGVYSRVRHPMYSAFWLWAVAQALLLPNWIAGPAGLVGFGTLFFLRVGREEALMTETLRRRVPPLHGPHRRASCRASISTSAVRADAAGRASIAPARSAATASQRPG